jgi:flavorubredoxin
MAEAVEDAFRYDRLVLATTTYNTDIFPFMREFIHHLTERNFQNRTVAMIENGSWAPQAVKVMTSMLEGCKDLTFIEPKVKIQSALNDTSREQIHALAEALCK